VLKQGASKLGLRDIESLRYRREKPYRLDSGFGYLAIAIETDDVAIHGYTPLSNGVEYLRHIDMGSGYRDGGLYVHPRLDLISKNLPYVSPPGIHRHDPLGIIPTLKGSDSINWGRIGEVRHMKRIKASGRHR
jgi:hypothetical protein